MKFMLQLFLCVFHIYFATHCEAIGFDRLYFATGSEKISSGSSYPLSITDEPIDTIWQCYRSIKMEINYFELDGQNGDFLMVSDVPFDEDIPDLANLNPEDELFRNSILVSNGLLMSWGVNQTIQIHSDSGVFLYFHAEKPTEETDRRKFFKGFDITLLDFDASRTTTMRPTPEPVLSTPKPGTQIYLPVFLSCKDPKEFAIGKADFKEQLAIMATEYCKDPKTCFVVGGFNAANVNIPDKEGIFLCDPKWPVYSTCVEVRFAILNEKYIMTREDLQDMWNKHSDSLIEKGYCPYTPPKSEDEIEVWIWVAFILGMILLFSALLCIVWVKKSNEVYNRSSKGERIQTSDVDNEVNGTGFFDNENPIFAILKKLQFGKGKDDAKYLEIVGELGSMVDEGGPVVKENKLFQMQQEYDNGGYIGDLQVDFEYSRSNPLAENFPKGKFVSITELNTGNTETDI